MNTKEVVEGLKELWNCNQEQIAERLVIGKSSISNYKKRTTTDIQTNIISALFEEIEKMRDEKSKLEEEIEILQRQIDLQKLAELFKKQSS